MVAEPDKANDGDEGLLVNVAGWTFQSLKRLSLLGLLRSTIWRSLDHRLYSTIIDVWILLHVAAACAAAFAAAGYLTYPNWAPAAVGLYAAYRLFEMVVVQTNMLLFDPYFARKRGESYSLRGRYRLALALFVNFGEVGFWFTSAYLFLEQDGFVTIEGASGVWGVFGLCMRSLVTFDVSPFHAQESALAVGIINTQAIIGVFLTLVMLARVMSLLPMPRADSDQLTPKA